MLECSDHSPRGKLPKSDSPHSSKEIALQIPSSQHKRVGVPNIQCLVPACTAIQTLASRLKHTVGVLQTLGKGQLHRTGPGTFVPPASASMSHSPRKIVPCAHPIARNLKRQQDLAEFSKVSSSCEDWHA
eukprot:467292-Amphidinium_carterae.1